MRIYNEQLLVLIAAAYPDRHLSPLKSGRYATRNQTGTGHSVDKKSIQDSPKQTLSNKRTELKDKSGEILRTLCHSVVGSPNILRQILAIALSAQCPVSRSKHSKINLSAKKRKRRTCASAYGVDFCGVEYDYLNFIFHRPESRMQ